MSDLRSVLERADRAVTGVPLPSDGLERLERRRDRRRRNQRFAAGAVGIAVFVIGVWAVTSIGVGTGDDGQRPGSSGATTPSVVPPTATMPWVAPPVAVASWVSPSAMSGVDYLMDVDTGEMTTLPDAILGTSGGRRGEQPDGRYAASPDGSTLAFTGLGVEGSPQIFIGNIDGTGVRQVTHDPVSATSPAWSPDGSTIAYVESGRDGIGPLVLLDVATGGTTLVTTEDASGPTFTPDGASLLFTASGPEYPLELRTVPITGGDSTPLFGADAGIDDSGNGSISPDGSLVTYLSSDTPPTDEARHCGPCRFLAFVDGSNRQVINGWMANAAGTWSPDGSRIVAEEILSELEMERLGGTYTDVILVVDVATEEATVVAYGRTAIWVDDHTILVEV